jgi:hypothetical protein
MDPVVTVDDDNVTVEPGGQASVIVRVRNLSSIVEGFSLDVLGDAAPWAQVLPGKVEVLPQGEAQATVLFAPPPGVTTRAGQVPFGIRAVSQVDPTASAVVEGDLHVGNVSLSQGRITPATSKGRWSGKHRIELSNWGNTPVRLALEVSDPEEALGFLITPDVLELPLGTAGTAKLKVRARKPFFRGAPLRRSFRVVGRPLAPGERRPAPGPAPQPYGYDPDQPAVDGAFEQRPIIGRGVLPVAMVALVAAGAIGFLTSRSGDDPEGETSPPPVPQAFTAASLTGDSVRLSWEPGERADSYTAFVVDPATRDDDRPRVVDQIDSIPGEQGQFDVPELEQSTEYCFQLAAVRGEATSARTDPQCATTAQVAGPGAPATPTDVTAERTDDGKVRVSWVDASAGAANHLVARGTSVLVVVEPAVSEQIVDATDDELCFTVQAKQGDQVSEPSEEACVEPAPEGGAGDGAAGAAPFVPGGVAPDDLGIVAVPLAPPGLTFVDDASGLALAEETRLTLVAQGLQPGLLLSTDYPELTPRVSAAAYLVYLPGFDTPGDALAACAAQGLTCETYTPGSPRPGARSPVPPAAGTATTAAPPTTPPTTAPPL